MAPHYRNGLVFAAACFAAGGVFAAAVVNGHLAFEPNFGSGGAAVERIDLSQTSEKPAPAAASQRAQDTALPQLQPLPAAQVTTAPRELATPALQARPNSVFQTARAGSLACRIPGRNDFMVEWDSRKKTAVANFSGTAIPGSLHQQRVAETNTLDSRLDFALEQDGHRLVMTIDDAGTMRASVDGRDSQGTCDPA